LPNRDPIFDANGRKTIPFWAAHASIARIASCILSFLLSSRPLLCHILTTRDEFENAPITGHFRFVSRDYHRDASVYEKLRFYFFSVYTRKRKAGVFKSSGLKSVYENFRFRDGLVWMVGLTVEIKLRFFTFPA